MAIFLTTERLIIQEPSLDDLEHLYALQSDPEVMQYVGRGVRTRDQVLAGLAVAIKHQSQYGFSLGAVYHKDSEQYIGRAGLIHLAYDDKQPDLEIGYALYKQFWNCGYATELSRAIIAWGFEHLAIQKLVGIIKPKNVRSKHVLEKAGMHFVAKAKYHGISVHRYEIISRRII